MKMKKSKKMEKCLTKIYITLWRVYRSPLHIVQGHTDNPLVVAIVLSDGFVGAQVPKSNVVIGARGNKVGTVGTEGTVPDPPLVALQGGLEIEAIFGGPDPGGVVCRTCGHMLAIAGQQDLCDVLGVGFELVERLQYGFFDGVLHFPDIAVSLVVAGYDH